MSNEDSSDAHDGDKQAHLIIKLKFEREQVKSSLDRFCRFIDRFTEDNIENLELRLRNVESTLLRDFTNIQNNLEMLNNDEKNSNEREHFEDLYYKYTAKAIKLIRKFYESGPNPGNIIQNPILNHNQPTVSSTKGFPAIELIKFYGEYDKWPQFRDLYKNLVHNDKHIDKIKKFYYLVGSLKGDAAKVVESIEITDTNYDLAWSLLEERYENKSLTIKNHVKAILDLPTVSNKDKYTLRNLLDDFQKRFRALKQLGEPVDQWSTLLIQILCNKLDFRTVNLWEEYVISQKIDHPILENLLNFLSDRCKFFETTDYQIKKDKKENPPPTASPRDTSKARHRQVYTVQTGKPMNCAYCKGKHQIYRCEKLTELSVASRTEEIKKLKLCLNCLRSNHSYNECISQGCRVCQKRHNTLLHENIESNNNTGDSQNVERTGLLVNHSVRNCTEVLLSTATVLIKDRSENWISCRALIDSGSQSNFMTTELAEKLDLKFYKTNIPVTGIGESRKNIMSSVTTEIKSADAKYLTKTSFLILDRITEKLPSQTFSKSLLKLPENVKLSDQNYNISSKIDLLLGVTIFYQALLPEKRELGEHMPILQNTIFGWVLSGPLPVFNSEHIVKCNFSTCETSLEDQMQNFWRIEEYSTQKFLTKEETECERIFTDTTRRDENDGHFVATLLSD